MSRKALASLAGATLLALAAATPASAAAPTPCNGMLYSDPAGDATYLDLNADLESPANANEDIRGLFFNYAPGDDGKPVLTANIVVQNLDKTKSAAKYATGTAWEVAMGGPLGDTYYLRASTDGTAWSFKYHYFNRVGTGQAVNPGTLATEDTKGQAFEGPMGVLSIQVPAKLPGLAEGAKLGGVDVVSIPRGSMQQPGFFNDRAPAAAADDKDYVVKACPAPEPAPATAPPPPPPAPVEPPPPPAQEQQAAPPAEPAQQQAPARPAAKKVDRKKECQKKARKLKGRKRAAALKKCAKIKRRR